MKNKKTTLILFTSGLLLLAGGYNLYLRGLFPFSLLRKAKYGVIEGSLGYPSEMIPEDVEACAERVSGEETFCTGERVEGDKYRYGLGYELRVPAGEYKVYARRPGPESLRGYPVNENKEPKTVEIEAGERITGMDLLHWESPEERAKEINFSETGNLLRNAPGLEKNVWYLSYKKPGWPGLKVKLSFGSEECRTPEGRPCDEMLDESLVGTRVLVEGFRRGDTVEIRHLRFIGE